MKLIGVQLNSSKPQVSYDECSGGRSEPLSTEGPGFLCVFHIIPLSRFYHRPARDWSRAHPQWTCATCTRARRREPRASADGPPGRVYYTHHSVNESSGSFLCIFTHPVPAGGGAAVSRRGYRDTPRAAACSPDVTRGERRGAGDGGGGGNVKRSLQTIQ